MLPDVIKKHCEEHAYKVYTAECLRMLTENTAKLSNGRYVTKSFSEIIQVKPVDKRTGDEIAMDVIKKAGLKVVVEGGEEK